MKKAVLVLSVLALALALVGPAAAKDMKGMWGPGYFTPDAPVGIRYWLTPKAALDIGIGFSQREIVTDLEGNTETKTGFTFEAGVPFVVASDDNTFFFIRPGFEFANDPVNADDSSTTIRIRGSLGVEHFFSNRFSLQVAHGIAFQSYDPGTKGSDSSTTLGSEAFGISSLGFHFYLFPNN